MFKLKEKRMNCITASGFISSYIDGELEESAVSILEKHLSICPECGAATRELKKLDTDIINLRGLQPGDGFTAGVMTEVKRLAGRTYPGVRRIAYSFIFAVFFLVGILINPIFQVQTPDPNKQTDLVSVLIDGQKFASVFDENSIIIGLTGGTNENVLD